MESSSCMVNLTLAPHNDEWMGQQVVGHKASNAEAKVGILVKVHIPVYQEKTKENIKIECTIFGHSRS